MLVHPNPMIKTGEGRWIDTHTKRVEVRPMLVNWGKHRKRWVVHFRQRLGSPSLAQTRHITEEQAVVSAQTLANRLKRISDKKDRKRAKRLAAVELSIKEADIRAMTDGLKVALENAVVTNQTAKAREQAREVVLLINRSFKLNS